ncbi:MAG: putative porin [Phycisphaerae bacterium]
MIGAAILMWLFCLASPLLGETAEDKEDMATTIAALKQRIKDQDRRLAEVESRQTTSQASTQALQQEEMRRVFKELNDEAAKNRPQMPGWLDNLKFAGDLRLRYDGQFYNWGKNQGDDKKNRNRARFRLRAGFVKTWLEDQMEVGFRLASGNGDSTYNKNGSDPTSTNQTFDGDWSKKPVWIDLAYAKYSPKQIKGLAIIGGKMIKPWVENEIFMDTDVNPEGFWAEYTLPKMGPVTPFVGSGYFLLRESADVYDATMAIYQAGVKTAITKDVKYTFAANLQDFDHYDDSGASANGNDSPLTKVPGFQVINLSNNLELPVAGKPLAFMGDWAHNCGATDSSNDYDDQRNAFATGVKWGQNKKKGDWSLKYRYAVVQANALPGQFVDSDFGFANRKGHVIGGEYNLMDNLTIGVNVFLTQPVFSPTTTSGSSPYEDMTATVLADLVWKF